MLHCQLSQLQPMSCWTCLQYKPVATITCCAYYAQDIVVSILSIAPNNLHSSKHFTNSSKGWMQSQVTYHLQVKSDSVIPFHDSWTHEVHINIIRLIFQLFHQLSHLQPVGDRGRGAPTDEPTLGSLTKTRRHTFSGQFSKGNDKCCF